jgi:hypothetical protein
MRDVLVVNGLEDEQGRALFLTSALYHSAAYLRHLVVRYIAVRSTAVEIAAQVLAFDTGLKVEWSDVHPEVSPDRAFDKALVYAAVAFSDITGFGFPQAAERGVAGCVAVQFPSFDLFPGAWAANLSAAHDPAIFATLLRSVL